MKKYIGKRIISFLIVLIGVSVLSFLLIAWSGKDPAEIIAHRGVSNPTPEQIEMIRWKWDWINLSLCDIFSGFPECLQENLGLL